MESKTVFSNGRNTFDTVIESETLVMRGQVTVGTSGNTFYGQIYTKSGEEYIGDYSQTRLLADQPLDRQPVTHVVLLGCRHPVGTAQF